MQTMRKLLLASLMGAAWVLTTAAQEECPRLRLAAKVHPNAKRGILAGRGQAKVTVLVQSKEPVEDLAFKMELPAGLSVVKTAIRPFPKTKTQLEVVQNADGTTAVYWLGVDFPHAKGSTRRFSAKVAVDACAPDTLAVAALAYHVNATDLNAYCAEPLAEPAILRVRYPGVKNGRLGKHGSPTLVTCAPTPAPSVNPATPFVPFGLGQRCLEAGRLAPFEDRRLSAYPDVKIQRNTISDKHVERRGLGAAVVISTPSDCYTYCSLNGGEPTPFFFNWNTVTDQCFCCGEECTLTFDPDFNAFQVVLAVSSAPTRSPSAIPTASPSSSPSSSPSLSPSSSPSASPSSSPSFSPSSSPTKLPTQLPTAALSNAPTAPPTNTPTLSPTTGIITTQAPTANPTPAESCGGFTAVNAALGANPYELVVGGANLNIPEPCNVILNGAVIFKFIPAESGSYTFSTCT